MLLTACGLREKQTGSRMKELGITLTSGDGDHLYEQIYRYIRDEIRAGHLRAGEKLPSTRALAAYLSISRSTAETAYDQLLSEGYLVSRRNSGFYVAEMEYLEGAGAVVPWQSEPGKRDGKNEAASSRPEPEYRDGENAAGPRQTGKDRDCIDFSPRRIDMSQFPYATWKRITRDNLVDANSEMFALGEPEGDRSFRETIAHYLYTSRGVLCDPDNLVIGAGNDYLLMLLCRLLRLEQDFDGGHTSGLRNFPGAAKTAEKHDADTSGQPVIGMEYVTYLRAARLFQTFGWTVAPVRMDEEGMCTDSLREQRCSLAYIMPSHQYPSGITMPIARRLQLLAWASEQEGRFLIEDDYDSEFRYRGKPVPSLKSSDRDGRVIYIGTFSKSIAPAIRVSYMLLPDAHMRRYRSSLYFLSSTVSRLDQRLLDRFIREGYFERYQNKMRTCYRGKRDVLLASLGPLADRFEVNGEGAGLHLLLTKKCDPLPLPACRTGEEKLARSASRAGVRVYTMGENLIPGISARDMEQFRQRPTILLGYAALTEKQIQEGAACLCAAWRQY